MAFPYSLQAPRVISPEVTLQAGQVLMPAAGYYWYKGGHYTNLERYDTSSQQWRFGGHDTLAMRMVYFDGQTVRIRNPTGCPVSAVVTNAGSGYTAAPAVTASAGASVWQSIVGGAVSTLGVIAAAGSGYTYPPILWIENPPNPGLQATGTVAITNGTISAITIVDQGAGYIYPPQATLVPDWRDTTGSGGVVTLALTGSGTITGVICTNSGNPIVSNTVPALTFGSGSAAATAVMDWAVSSVSITTAGAGYGNSAAVTASAAGGYVTSTPAYLGGLGTLGMSRWWPASIDVTTNSTGGMSAVAAIIDGGRYQSVPFPTITAASAPTTTGVLALTMGGVNSTVFLMPVQQT